MSGECCILGHEVLMGYQQKSNVSQILNSLAKPILGDRMKPDMDVQSLSTPLMHTLYQLEPVEYQAPFRLPICNNF